MEELNLEASDATRSSLVRRLHDWSDDAGWKRFFETYWKLIYSVAIKSGLSDAEAQDVVQETVLGVAKAMRADGYDRTKSSFKTFLYTISRRRIIDHFRKRSKAVAHGIEADLEEIDSGERLENLWETEWQKNLVELAVETVKQKVAAKQFQIFDLTTLRAMPIAKATRLLKVSSAQIYLARHRVGALIKQEVKRLQRSDP